MMDDIESWSVPGMKGAPSALLPSFHSRVSDGTSLSHVKKGKWGLRGKVPCPSCRAHGWQGPDGRPGLSDWELFCCTGISAEGIGCFHY